MSQGGERVRVLFSFPNKLGAQRICYTAWQQVNGLAAAGADVTVFTGDLLRPVPHGVKVHTTLARGKVRIPYKLIGSSRAWSLHDYIVSRHLEKNVGKIDIIHTWPQGALRTLRAASKLGIPTVLERCNAHTRFSYEAVQKECERLGVALPPGHESAFNEKILERDEEEFRSADRLLCPSEFVVRTFLERGFSQDRLARHIYGFDEKVYYPSTEPRPNRRGINALFVGVCAVRKGVHLALEAWLKSPAHREGTFSIAGEFLPAYAQKLAPMLSHASVRALGHRDDVPELMRQSDILILPSLEEGFGLVCTEAMGSGCVPLVSDACTDICRHGDNAMVHRVGDVETLSRQITMLHEDRTLLERLRTAGLAMRDQFTWTAAGVRLLEVYQQTIRAHSRTKGRQVEAVLVPSFTGNLTPSC
ncbi:MAG: glycosyltransferase family 4 protein [Candidatus Sulfotelmatobacter sp.]|jgi:glycosyltransferase involved in cell wall biosynthesis